MKTDFRFSLLALLAAVLACSNVLPPLPGASEVGSTPQLPDSVTAFPSSSVSAKTVRVEAESLTVRIRPETEAPTPCDVRPDLWPDKRKCYLEAGEDVLRRDCRYDNHGNLWMQVVPNGKAAGWAAAWYSGEIYLYPLDCD